MRCLSGVGSLSIYFLMIFALFLLICVMASPAASFSLSHSSSSGIHYRIMRKRRPFVSLACPHTHPLTRTHTHPLARTHTHPLARTQCHPPPHTHRQQTADRSPSDSPRHTRLHRRPRTRCRSTLQGTPRCQSYSRSPRSRSRFHSRSRWSRSAQNHLQNFQRTRTPQHTRCNSSRSTSASTRIRPSLGIARARCTWTSGHSLPHSSPHTSPPRRPRSPSR